MPVLTQNRRMLILEKKKRLMFLTEQKALIIVHFNSSELRGLA